MLVLVLCGSFWGRHTEASMVPYGDFLRDAKQPFRSWAIEEIGLREVEREMLQPDSAIVRRYIGPKKQGVELAVIAGHRKRSVHHPGFCMVGGGWNAVSQGTCSIQLPDHRITANRLVMNKEGQGMIATFFFTDGELGTHSMPQFQWAQLKERLSGRTPLGALVRVLVPVTGRGRQGMTEAETLSDDFIRTMLPGLLRRVREARSGAHVYQTPLRR